jgi:hypothetical protein
MVEGKDEGEQHDHAGKDHYEQNDQVRVIPGRNGHFFENRHNLLLFSG